MVRGDTVVDLWRAGHIIPALGSQLRMGPLALLEIGVGRVIVDRIRAALA